MKRRVPDAAEGVTCEPTDVGSERMRIEHDDEWTEWGVRRTWGAVGTVANFERDYRTARKCAKDWPGELVCRAVVASEWEAGGRTANAPEPTPERPNGASGVSVDPDEGGRACSCWTCTKERAEARDGLGLGMPMCVCSDCGNKRCPKATHHDNECSGSNRPGQEGSRYA